MVDERFPGGDEGTSEPEHGPALDETRLHEAPAAGARQPDDDATTALPASDGAAEADGAAAAGGTAAGAAAARSAAGAGPPGAGPPAAPVSPRWSARAHVPPPGAGPDTGPADWEERAEYSYPADRYPTDPYGGRSWLTPVVVALAVLLLLATLAVGVYLILRFTDKGGAPGPGPTVSPSASALPSATPPSTPPSSPAAPTSSAPGPVAMPKLVGLTEAATRQQLQALGLTVRVTNRPVGNVPAGTVVETIPVAGTLVNPGTEVTIVVAVAPPPPPTPSPTPSPTASGD